MTLLVDTESRIIRPTRRRRQNSYPNSPHKRRRYKHKLISPILPLRSRIEQNPHHGSLNRIYMIRCRLTLECPAPDLTLQGRPVLIRCGLVERCALDMTLGGSILAKSGQIEHGDETGFDGS